MKLIKLLPLIGLMLSVTVTSAFAVGKDSSDDTTGKMCQKLAAALIKQDHKEVSPNTPARSTDPGKGPATGSSAM